MKPVIVDVLTSSPQRIDKFLAEYFHEWSRTYISKLIQNNNIQVNQKNIRPSSKVICGDKITCTFPIHPSSIESLDRPLEILYQDAYLAVINKPYNLSVHPGAGKAKETLINRLIFHFAELSNLSGVMRPGIVHRLDKDVSGLMLACKNQKTFEYFKKQFQERKIRKVYTVLVHGQMEKPEGLIDMPIVRATKGGKMAVKSKTQGGKEALTKYTVIKQFKNFTLVEAEILTGRTHQIRAHFNALNHPVVGDKLYKQKKVKEKLAIDRPFLHSTILGFTNLKGEYQEFKSKLPAKLEKTIKELK